MEGLDIDKIQARLGSLKDLAKAYLDDLLDSKPSFFKKLMIIIAYYGLVDINGMFILPILSIFVLSFGICGIIIVPITYVRYL